MNYKLILFFLNLIQLRVIAQGTTKNIIYNSCFYFEDRDENDKYKDCVDCLNGVYNGATDATDDQIKTCFEKMPSRYSSCAENAQVKKCLVSEVLKVTKETNKIFQDNHKEILSVNERIRLSQVWSAFVMYISMLRDLPKRVVREVVEPIQPCFVPGVDLSSYDEIESEGLVQDTNNTLRIVREADVTKSLVKSVNRRAVRFYACSMKKVYANKDAREIIKDYLRTYHGAVPAMVAQNYCK